MSLPIEAHVPPSEERGNGAEIIPLDQFVSRVSAIRQNAILFDNGVLYLNESFRGPDVAYVVEATRSSHGVKDIRQVPQAVIRGFLDSERLVPEDQAVQSFNDQQVKRELGELARSGGKRRATDIHLIPGKGNADYTVQYRKNRDLYALDGYTPEFAEKLMTAAHVAAKDSEPSYLPGHYQQARIMPEAIGGVPGYEAIRIQYTPTSDGRAMFWRLQRPLIETYGSLEGLNYSRRQVALIKKSIQQGKGATLVAAPTNAGKTTLLGMMAYTKLQLEGRLNGVCLEDPPEYTLPLVQMSINAGDDPEQIRIENSKALKAINRMDPDFVYMGEIRGSEAGSTMVSLASTHPTFGGFHAENSFEALPQLARMGIDENDVFNANIVRNLFVQRLVQVLCDNCSKTVSSDDIGRSAALTNIAECGVAIDGVRKKGPGCPKCDGTGVLGMRPLIEIVKTTPYYVDAIRNRDVSAAKKNLTESECLSIADEGLAAVARGECDGENLIKELGEINPEDIRLFSRHEELA